MTGLEDAKLITYNAISSIFETYRHDIEWVPAMPEIVVKFQSFLKELNNLAMQNEKDLKTFPKARKQKRDILVRKLLSLNHAIVVSAQLNNQNPDHEFPTSESRLQLKKESELYAEVTQSIQKAKLWEKQIIPALIDAHAIKELQKARDEFMEIAATAKEAGEKRITTNRLIRDKMKELDHHLRNKVDLIIPLFKEKNPDLYNTYKETRKVKNKTYTARALFNGMIRANSTQTVADIDNQPNNWLLIKNTANTGLSVYLSMIKDVALGEGISIPAQGTIYRQVKNLNPDTRARYLIAKNDDRKNHCDLEIWMGG